MKNVVKIMALLLMLCSTNMEAQIFKKLKKTVERAAEEAVIRKTEQKVNKETEKVMDTLLDGDMGKKNKKIKRVNLLRNAISGIIKPMKAKTFKKTLSMKRANKMILGYIASLPLYQETSSCFTTILQKMP